MGDQSFAGSLSLDEALDLVEARFLYNLPADELSNIVSISKHNIRSFDPHDCISCREF